MLSLSFRLLGVVAALSTLLTACGSTGGGNSPYTTLRDGERAESAPGAGTPWSLAISGSDVTLEVDGRTLILGGAAGNRRLRYAEPPGAVLKVQIMGQPPLIILADAIVVSARSYDMPHPGRYAVDLSADPPF